MAIGAIAVPGTPCVPQARFSGRSRPVATVARTSSYLGSRLALCRPISAPRLQRAQRGAALPVRASIFGVGAPEAILVGVVALLVFGPKGLAQAAKGLGQTLRAFQPTIRELTQVGVELKSTLEQEIGIDEIRSELAGRPAVPPPRPATPAAALPAADAVEAAEAASSSSSADGAAAPAAGEKEQPALSQLAADMQAGIRGSREQLALAIDPEIERKRAESAAMAWGGAATVPAAAAAPAEVAPAAQQQQQQQQPKALEQMSMEELEAELARRRAAAVTAGQLPRQL